MITGIDHFVILVHDLDAAMRTYQRLGFDVCRGGEHRSFGSHNALVGLADQAYLELLAFTDRSQANETIWREAVQKLDVEEGFDGYALISGDLANDVSQMRERSLQAGDPYAGSRLRPDGVRLSWRMATLGATRFAYLPFLIQDDTPRELRIEPVREGLGARSRVKEIVIAVRDLAEARDAFHVLLNMEPEENHDQAQAVRACRFLTAWGAIVLAQPQDNGAMARQLSARGEGVFALTLAVDDLERARRELDQRGIRIEVGDNRFLVSRHDACGARLNFVHG